MKRNKRIYNKGFEDNKQFQSFLLDVLESQTAVLEQIDENMYCVSSMDIKQAKEKLYSAMGDNISFARDGFDADDCLFFFME